MYNSQFCTNLIIIYLNSNKIKSWITTFENVSVSLDKYMSEMLLNFHVIISKNKNVILHKNFQKIDVFQSSILKPKVLNYFWKCFQIWKKIIFLIKSKCYKFIATLLLELRLNN
jgi:hypothetical protein